MRIGLHLLSVTGVVLARKLNRYEFLFMAAPLRVEKGMGSPLNPLAIF